MGRKEFEQVVAQAPKKALQKVMNSFTTPLPATTGNELITLYAPAGNLTKVAGMWLSVDPPIGATSGTHELFVYYDTLAGNNIILLYATSPFNNKVRWESSMWKDATTAEPTDKTAQIEALKNITFDDTVPLVVAYYNKTNAVAAAQRVYNFSLVNEQVTK